MPLSQTACIAAITEHSAGFVDAVRNGKGLDAEVEFCPGWTVADLVRHVIGVHWVWATIVQERLPERPAHGRGPPDVDDDDLLPAFEAGAARLTQVLAAADPRDHVWTWAPAQQDAGFVIRHQVQEIVVHHWDAAHAAGEGIDIDPLVGADSVDEFLHFSVWSADDPGDPLPEALGGSFALRCTDSDAAWLVTDGATPGTAAVSDAPREDVPGVAAAGGDLLLWVYGRVTLDTADVDAVDPKLLTRFRRMSFTD